MGLKDEYEGGAGSGGTGWFGVTYREARMKRMGGLQAKSPFCLRSQDKRAARGPWKSLQEGVLENLPKLILKLSIKTRVALVSQALSKSFAPWH